MAAQPLYGDELVLSILEKELVSITKKAEKAKADCDATMNAGSQIMEIRRQASLLINNALGSYTEKGLAEMNRLAEQEKKLLDISRRDLIKLMDAEHHAAHTRDELTRIVQQMRFRIGFKRA